VVWTVAKVQTTIDQQLAQMPQGMVPKDVEAKKAEAYREIVRRLVNDDEQAEFLVSVPVIILFFFWATRVFLPWLIALMTYDQIAGELHHRSARYTLLRARRGALLAGKILANMVLLVGLTMVTNLILVGFSIWKIPDFDVGGAALFLLRFWLLILPLALAYVSIMAFLSSLFRFPYFALLAGLAFLMLTGVLSLLASAWEKLAPLRWALPWHYGSYLISHRLEDQLLGVGAFLGLALLFSLGAWGVLRRRDV
jgi:ABC-type transport system involved in multi-copper enzyme maturation permease subunit